MIRGERVTLRPVEEPDYPLIQAWQNDPEVWWLMDYERPFSLVDIAESEKRAAEEGFPFIIEVDGRPIGRIGINNLRRRDRICALYIFIGDREVWGKGLGTDAIDTLLAHVFRRFDLHQVELLVARRERTSAPRVRAFRVPRGGASRRALMERRSLGRSRPHVGDA